MPAGPGPGPATGKPAGAVTAPTFSAATLDGGTLNFPGDYRGKKVLLVFWATWCAPCRAELPHLREARDKLGGRGLEIVGVSLDTKPPSAVKSFADEHKLTWRHAYDNDAAIARKYGVTAIPAMFLVDGSTGNVLASGTDLTGGDLVRMLEKYLKS